MKEVHTVRHIRLLFLAMACMLLFTLTVNIAHADAVSGAQVSIAPSGQVIVRDAEVISISGRTIIAKSAWGAMGITWRVETSGSTRFVPESTSAEAIKAIKPGDLIAFSGEVDTSSGQASVRATVVRDASLQQDSIVQTGIVLGIDSESRSFTMKYGEATTTVVLAGGTILTRDGNLAELSDLAVDDTVKVFGSLNTVTDTLKADKVSWKSSAQSVNGPPGGIFAGIFAWLSGSRGIFSTR